MCDRIDMDRSLLWGCSSLSSSSSSVLLLLYYLCRRRELYHPVKKKREEELKTDSAGAVVETVWRGGGISETSCGTERKGTSCVVDATMDNEGQEG